MLQSIESDPSIGAVSGQLLNSDRTIQIGYNVRRFPSASTFALDFLLFNKLFPNNPINRRHRMLDYNHLEARPVDVAVSCALMIRRQVFGRIGLFDENLGPAWLEDIDFCMRMKRMGYKILYCPQAKFVHIDSDKKLPRGANSKHLIVWEHHTLFYLSYLNYSRKYFGRSVATFLRICITLGMIERIAFSYLTPSILRRRLDKVFKLYDPDEVILKHREVFWHTLLSML